MVLEHACFVFSSFLFVYLFMFVLSELTEAGPLALRCLMLKDFENSIDLTTMPDPRNIMFTGSNKSDSFECYEMKTGKPWKYQVLF